MLSFAKAWWWPGQDRDTHTARYHKKQVNENQKEVNPSIISPILAWKLAPPHDKKVLAYY